MQSKKKVFYIGHQDFQHIWFNLKNSLFQCWTRDFSVASLFSKTLDHDSSPCCLSICLCVCLSLFFSFSFILFKTSNTFCPWSSIFFCFKSGLVSCRYPYNFLFKCQVQSIGSLLQQKRKLLKKFIQFPAFIA